MKGFMRLFGILGLACLLGCGPSDGKGDSEVKEEEPCGQVLRWDDDGDGYGSKDPDPHNESWVLNYCEIVERHPEMYVGWAPNSDDCDDADAAINPAAEEVCNGIDDNCDGDIDDVIADAADFVAAYEDADGDGFGYGDAVVVCQQEDGYPAQGYVTNSDDCNDILAEINPAAEEICGNNWRDDDCDGEADEEDEEGCVEK